LPWPWASGAPSEFGLQECGACRRKFCNACSRHDGAADSLAKSFGAVSRDLPVLC
jgi:hypothetical protein